ncbi:MAG: IMP dehydrogenase, partial [Candidatus Paceibacteria bacterium]
MRSAQDRWLRSVLAGCTLDDFLISPGWGKAKSRKGISLASVFSTNIKLNLPIVSANMDTITGARMAIAMAREGGMGIIHRYLSIEDQCEKVREVKRHESLVIEEPYSISPYATISEARMLMNRNKVGGLVVVDLEGRFVGLLSSRDVRFADENQIIAERMKPVDQLIVARPDITLKEAKKLLDKHRLEKLPLVEDNFKLRGLITSKDIENLERYPLANKDASGRLVVGASIGAVGDYLERAAELIKADVDVIVIDIANFQSDIGKEAVIQFRKKFPDTELVVGNLVIPEAVKVYQRLGVNGIKVGLGSGSACT